MPEGPPVVVDSRPGTFYFGGLTGPHHQVVHQPSPPDQLMQGEYSVGIMQRTTWF